MYSYDEDTPHYLFYRFNSPEAVFYFTNGIKWRYPTAEEVGKRLLASGVPQNRCRVDKAELADRHFSLIRMQTEVRRDEAVSKHNAKFANKRMTRRWKQEAAREKAKILECARECHANEDTAFFNKCMNSRAAAYFETRREAIARQLSDFPSLQPQVTEARGKGLIDQLYRQFIHGCFQSEDYKKMIQDRSLDWTTGLARPDLAFDPRVPPPSMYDPRVPPPTPLYSHPNWLYTTE